MKPALAASRPGWLAWGLVFSAMLPGLSQGQRAGGLDDPQSSAAQELNVEPNRNHPDPNGSILAPEPPASLEDLRALLHLYTRLDRAKMVGMVAGRILRRDPRDRETLRLLASYHLERKEPQPALQSARALVKFYPGDTEGNYLLAMACKLNGQNREATEVLTRLKSAQFRSRHFPYEAELASAAWLSGDWPQAVRSYQAVLEHPTLSPEQRSEARHQLEHLLRAHLPQLFLQERFTYSGSGLIFRSLLDWSQALSARHRLRLELERDDLTLDRTDLLQSQRTDRYDALAGVESDFLRWRTKVFGGGGDEGVVYGADFTRVLGTGEDLVLAWHGNQRATDSLLLEVLHGREDELSVVWNAQFGPEVTARLKLRGRRVLVDGEVLGYGYGAELNLERVILRALPRLHLGYRGLVTGFSQESSDLGLVAGVVAPGTSDLDQQGVLESLVSPINLHGIYLSWNQPISPEWAWHAVVGGDYSFTRSSFGQNLELGVSYAPSRRTEVALTAGYSTSAETSDQDTERFELSLSFRCRF